MDISVDEKTCLNIKEALRLEWLETNGLGGYASSTILNCHTRRYHGLLVANLTEPSGRFVLLSKFEESIQVKDREFFLSFHKYPGVFFPLGYKYLRGFRARPAPHFTYRIGDVVIHKTVMMLQGQDGVLVRYFCERSDIPVMLRLKPFLAFRDFHSLSKENLSLRVATSKVRNGFTISPYDGMPPLFIQTSGTSTFFPSPVWYRNFEYLIEAERGFDFHEDLFQPGILEVELQTGDSVIVSASTRELTAIEKKWDAEEADRRKTAAQAASTAKAFEAPEDRKIVQNLLETSKSFLIKQPRRGKPGRPTVVAGYHWFVDWGRDTLISLPGLTFCAGEPDTGTAILESIGKYEQNGLLPNFFAADGTAHAYNSVDCSLWYFWAIQQMLLHTGNLESVRRFMWPVMVNIFQHFKAGTEHGIYMNEKGLLHAGDAQTQLTWMDASVDGKPVTPRCGYPVDINALWYNAICFLNELSDKFGKDRNEYAALADKIRNAFNETFWIEDGAYLGDVFHEGILDPSVRPNQILAVSLPYSPLDRERSKAVFEKVCRELLTPYGLRTLSPRDRAYQGRYSGGPAERDGAYHQGTVWPWLIGHFGEAYLKVAENRKEAGLFLLADMRGILQEHLKSAGLDFISEIFDGDPPHHPHGCIAQAWSMAEVIRLYFLLSKTL